MRPNDTVAMSKDSETEARVRKVELLISNLLRSGVLLSLFCIVVGVVVSYVEHPEYLSERASRVAGQGAGIAQSIDQVRSGLMALQGEAIVTLGILLLIATPVMRVGLSIFAFIYQRDRLYTAVTTLVFCLLLLSFVLGKTE